MKLVDIHCHLQAECYRDNLDEVIERAHANGVVCMLNAATTPGDWDSCRQISKKYADCKFALGIHPWYIREKDSRLLAGLTENDFSGASAIGEIGLDKKNEVVPFELQYKICEQQMKIASDLHLPVVFHCRGAFHELHILLKKIPLTAGGIIHNFNESAELARQLFAFGLSFSLGGLLTRRDSIKRVNLLKEIYPENFLLETDSPDIPPVEVSGALNEPANILYNLIAAAEMLEKTPDEVADNTTKVARRYLKF